MIDGRIIRGVGGLYAVQTEGGVYACKARGVFRNKKITPVIGDICEIEIQDNTEKTGNIISISTRRNELMRPRVANIDQIAIITATREPSLNLNLLDRFIVTLESLNRNKSFKIIICISKVDLPQTGQLEDIKEMYESAGYPVVFTSIKKDNGLDGLYPYLENKVTAFSGISGVGKSSIINTLLGEEMMETGVLSRKIERGRHTTRHVELLHIWDNSYVIDTPGFASLHINEIDRNELRHYFKEFNLFERDCRFIDCQHVHEPDCAVKAHIGSGIYSSRYENYLLFYEGAD